MCFILQNYKKLGEFPNNLNELKKYILYIK